MLQLYLKWHSERLGEINCKSSWASTNASSSSSILWTGILLCEYFVDFLREDFVFAGFLFLSNGAAIFWMNDVTAAMVTKKWSMIRSDQDRGITMTEETTVPPCIDNCPSVVSVLCSERSLFRGQWPLVFAVCSNVHSVFSAGVQFLYYIFYKPFYRALSYKVQPRA